MPKLFTKSRPRGILFIAACMSLGVHATYAARFAAGVSNIMCLDGYLSIREGIRPGKQRLFHAGQRMELEVSGSTFDMG